MVKNLPANAGDRREGSIPGPGRSPGGGHGKPGQYPCLENPPGQREPGGLQSVGSQSQTLSDLASRHRADCHLQLKTAPFHGGEWINEKTHPTTHILGVALWV